MSKPTVIRPNRRARLAQAEGLSPCSSCASPSRPYDNIPVLSWLLGRGRCRSCRAAIPARYRVVDVGTVGLCVGVVLAHSEPAQSALGVLLVLLVVSCALIDLEHRIIPNRLTGPAALLALVVGSVLDPSGEPARLIAGAAAGTFLLLPALIRPGGMGMGDVKLAAVMGLCLGSAVAPAILVALVAGVVGGGVLIAQHGAQEARKRAIPFGPFLALGALFGIFVGPALVHWYTSSLH